MNPTYPPAPAFSPQESSRTSPSEWFVEPAPAVKDVADLLPGSNQLLIIAAHPDDETLGAAGLAQRAHAAGLPVTVLVATDGAGSHPHSPTHSASRLARIRSAEVAHALEVLAPGSRLVQLGLPDGQLNDHLTEVTNAAVDLIGRQGNALIASTYRGDGHCDHEAAAEAAARAAERTDSTLVEYPIWLWHWGRPADLSHAELFRLALSAAERETKARAVSGHRSQVEPLSAEPGDEVLLPAHVLSHFGSGSEWFVKGGQPSRDPFDELHADSDDPWSVTTSPYEQHKRSALLGQLRRDRYRRILEIGCSIGGLTRFLAERTDALVAVDSSATAIAGARRRLPHLDWRQLRIPEQWPEGSFDLVVISEVAYYLSPNRLQLLIQRVRQALEHGGEIALCHWRHRIEGWTLDADAVHSAFAASFALEVSTATPDYLLDRLRLR